MSKNTNELGPERRAVAEFIYHYHGERNHQGLGNAFVFLDTTRAMKRPFGDQACRPELHVRAEIAPAGNIPDRRSPYAGCPHEVLGFLAPQPEISVVDIGQVLAVGRETKLELGAARVRQTRKIGTVRGYFEKISAVSKDDSLPVGRPGELRHSGAPTRLGPHSQPNVGMRDGDLFCWKVTSHVGEPRWLSTGCRHDPNISKRCPAPVP